MNELRGASAQSRRSRCSVRPPFIPETSLGHEIAHQWFGNYVYADFGKGNWLEAITSTFRIISIKSSRAERAMVMPNRIFNSQFRVMIERERGRFWSSFPGRGLLILSAATTLGFAMPGE